MDYFIDVDHDGDEIDWIIYGYAPDGTMSMDTYNVDKVKYQRAKGIAFHENKWGSFYGATVHVRQKYVFGDESEAQQALFKLVFKEDV